MKIFELPYLYLQCFGGMGANMLCVDATYDVLLDVVDFFDSDAESTQMGIDDYDNIKTFADCFYCMKDSMKAKYAEAMEEYIQTESGLIKRVKAKHKMQKLGKAALDCDVFEKVFNQTLKVNLEQIYNITKEENEVLEEG